MDEDKPLMVEVPFGQLAPLTLDAVIESFILREGTDYGSQESVFETKRAQVRGQLDRGQVKLVFDPETESCTLLTDKQFSDVQKNQ